MTCSAVFNVVMCVFIYSVVSGLFSPHQVQSFQQLKKRTYLSYVFKVVVSLLQGSGSVKGFPHAGVFAEEGLAVVLDPVHHLNDTELFDYRSEGFMVLISEIC